MNCRHCDEPIEPCDVAIPVNSGREKLHRECMFRLTVGSVAHQRRACSCYGGTESDAPGMTLRQAARAAFDYGTRNRVILGGVQRNLN